MAMLILISLYRAVFFALALAFLLDLEAAFLFALFALALAITIVTV